MGAVRTLLVECLVPPVRGYSGTLAPIEVFSFFFFAGAFCDSRAVWSFGPVEFLQRPSPPEEGFKCDPHNLTICLVTTSAPPEAYGASVLVEELCSQGVERTNRVESSVMFCLCVRVVHRGETVFMEGRISKCQEKLTCAQSADCHCV